MKKMTVQKPRQRVKKAKSNALKKGSRPVTGFVRESASLQWPDFKSRLTKARATPVRDMIDELRLERV